VIILVLCLILGFTLRYYRFDQKSLWVDEVHTFNESSDGFKGQIRYYEENPTSLHPPLFFILTHLFYPFKYPERDLRIIPLIFGTLSVPMIYFLAKSFSPTIALPCALSLAFMTYHISLSQDGRSYSLLMFLGMAGLYFFLKHLKTSKNRYLILVALLFAILFHTSYSSIPFITLSQILWFYRPDEETKKPTLSSFFILNGLILLFCLPWILFVAFNYKGKILLDSFASQSTGTFPSILVGIFNDWAPHGPLMIASALLLSVFPVFSKDKRNAFCLLMIFILPVGGVYLVCRLFHFEHFFNSRYFITVLPVFLVALYLSVYSIEVKWKRVLKTLRLTYVFLIFFIVSSTILLPIYYQSEKQNFRGLVAYLNEHLANGDKIYLRSPAYYPGILHYFGIKPESRHYNTPYGWNEAINTFEYKVALANQNRRFSIYHSAVCCAHYVEDGSRLWVVVGKPTTKEIKESTRFVLKGYFDGNVSSFRKFPEDASFYLFLWDPKSPAEKGMDMPMD
jgi:4-amino-4-deoxy-L-arabinose transferase-like glycosyltransferase